jgi:betaine lipid synthase
MRSGCTQTLSLSEYILRSFSTSADAAYSVLRGLTNWSLTRAVIMDHLDWFKPGSAEVDDEIDELHRVLSSEGFVLWRSAARKPWYNEV